MPLTVAAGPYDGGQAPLVPSEYLATINLSTPTPTLLSAIPAAQVASALYNTPHSSSGAVQPPSFRASSPENIIVSQESIPKPQRCASSQSKSVTPAEFASTGERTWQTSSPTLDSITSFLGISEFLKFHPRTRLQLLGASGSAAESRWMGSSHSWVNRQLCSWFGVCGPSNLIDQSRWTGRDDQNPTQSQQGLEEEETRKRAFWSSGRARPDDWTEDERRLREIPQYILDYAPFVHLYSDEEFWPCDVADHLIHTTPHLNYTPLQAGSDSPNLTNLNELNKYGPRHVYLQSDDNVEERPEWLGGKSNIPAIPDDENCKVVDPNLEEERKPDLRGTNNIFERKGPKSSLPGRAQMEKKKKPCGGRSDAPAVLVAIDKGDGIVDAFWFFFYSYNLGNIVFNLRFGNHVGDWEHTLVRFKYGEPIEIFFSEHSFGEAYAYHAVEKIGKRVSHLFPLEYTTRDRRTKTFPASSLLRNRHPRHVRHTRYPRLYPALGPTP